MKQCLNCGKVLHDKAKFCGACGTRQEQVDDVQYQYNNELTIQNQSKLKPSISATKANKKDVSLSLIFSILAIVAAVMASIFIYYTVICFSRISYLANNCYIRDSVGVPYYYLSVERFFPLYPYSLKVLVFGSLALFFFPFLPLSIIYGVKEMKKCRKQKKNQSKAIAGISLGGIAISEFLIFFITMLAIYL